MVKPQFTYKTIPLAKKSELIVKREKSDLIGPIKKAYIKKLK